MTINAETLIYHSLPFKKYRWISYISTIQIGFLFLNMVVLPTPRLMLERQEALKNKVKKKSIEKVTQHSGEFIEEFEPNPDYDPATIFQRFQRLEYKEIFSYQNIRENLTDRPIASFGLMGVSFLVIAAFCTYARRMVHQIVLLPGERVRFSFFSPFAIGKPPSVELPLHDISCVHGRKSPHNYSILKFKGSIGYHLVHKSEGQFLEPKLYDKHLGFARSWYMKS